MVANPRLADQKAPYAHLQPILIPTTCVPDNQQHTSSFFPILALKVIFHSLFHFSFTELNQPGSDSDFDSVSESSKCHASTYPFMIREVVVSTCRFLIPMNDGSHPMQFIHLISSLLSAVCSVVFTVPSVEWPFFVRSSSFLFPIFGSSKSGVNFLPDYGSGWSFMSTPFHFEY